MNVKEIVIKYLQDNGYIGLDNPDLECGCRLDDEIAPCGEIGMSCMAYRETEKNCGNCAHYDWDCDYNLDNPPSTRTCGNYVPT